MAILDESVSTLDRFVNFINPYLNKIIIFLMIIFTGIIIGKILGKFLERSLKSIEVDSFMKKNFNLKNFTKKSSNLISWIIYVAALLIALNTLGLTTTVLNILFAVVIISIVITVLISVKDIIPNLIAGVKLKQQGKLKEGMTIELDNSKGKIISINLIEITLKNTKGEEIILPNNLLIKKKFKIIKKGSKNNSN